MIQAEVIITDPLGLHARPAADLVKAAGKFQAAVTLHLEDGARKANARSIIQLMKLNVRKGDVVKIEVEGLEAAEALAAILAVIVGDRIS